MKLRIFTIALDAMPFITWHLPIFNRLKLDWEWTIVEGTSGDSADSSHLTTRPKRISKDGTHEFLKFIAQSHARVRHIHKPFWDCKTDMCNAALCDSVDAGDFVFQVDCDELWQAPQIHAIISYMIANPHKNAVRVPCKTFVGPNALVQAKANEWGNCHWDGRRMWKADYAGFKFVSHSPPEVNQDSSLVDKDVWRGLGVFLEHFNYYLPEQVKSKDGIYKANGKAYPHWKKLHTHKEFPAKLKQFLPFVFGNPMVVEAS